MSARPLILVVDDDPFMRDLTQIHLEAAGMSVAHASDGVEGVAKARSLKPAVLIMDFAMPGLSGTDALRQIRVVDGLAELPVLLLTAWSSEEGRREAEALGAVWLEKPVVAQALVDAVRRILPQ